MKKSSERDDDCSDGGDRLTQVHHNHEVKEPTRGELYHPDSDPRLLEFSCPACREIMQQWDCKIRQMMADGA
jgi:hypothetical protein